VRKKNDPYAEIRDEVEVQHHTFGRGRVYGRFGDKVVVIFRRCGIKTLMLQYAKLEVIRRHTRCRHGILETSKVACFVCLHEDEREFERLLGEPQPTAG
jgi:hypothetical protein